MTRIVCVGITVLDRIWYLDDLPKEGGKYVAKDYTEAVSYTHLTLPTT
ncbi:hypothetical protein HBA26_19650, partial [Enterobacter sp. 725m/11]|nr:hypothetical protein [Enterobacter sp. 725m/11]